MVSKGDKRVFQYSTLKERNRIKRVLELKKNKFRNPKYFAGPQLPMIFQKYNPIVLLV